MKKRKLKPRGKPFHGQPGPGRPKGLKNKTTHEVRDIAQRLVGDETYLKALGKRLCTGDVPPQVEVMLWQYGWGKPPEQPIVIDHSITDKTPAQPADDYKGAVEVIRRLVGSGVIPAEALARLAPSGNGDGNGGLVQ